MHTTPLPHPRLGAALGLAGLLTLPGSAALAASPMPAEICWTDAPGTIGTIDHPTEPTVVVLRMTVAGGFVPVDWALTDGPTFTLYGNNVAIYRPADWAQEFPGPGEPWPAYMCSVLEPEQVDELLRFALEDGGLADARASYDNPTIVDVPWTTFDIDADGVTRTVAVFALGFEGGEDPEARAGFQALADLLGSFETVVAQGKAGAPVPFEPAVYRGILTEVYGEVPSGAIPWPWDDVSPDDFVSNADGYAGSFAPLTPEQVSEVTEVPNGGMMGLIVVDEAGTAHSLSIRPILPGEEVVPA